MRFDIGTLDSGERSLPFGLLGFIEAVKLREISSPRLHKLVLDMTFSI